MNSYSHMMSPGRIKAITKRKRGAMADCAHCGEPGIVRSSETVTPLHRDFYFTCSNPKCGHSWKAQLSFVHTIALPAQQKEGLQLPVMKPRSTRNGDPPIARKPAA